LQDLQDRYCKNPALTGYKEDRLEKALPTNLPAKRKKLVGARGFEPPATCTLYRLCFQVI
jgi:hypothetical protein